MKINHAAVKTLLHRGIVKSNLLVRILPITPPINKNIATIFVFEISLTNLLQNRNHAQGHKKYVCKPHCAHNRFASCQKYCF